MSYPEEEDTCMAYEEEDTFLTCLSDMYRILDQVSSAASAVPSQILTLVNSGAFTLGVELQFQTRQT